MTKIRTTLTEHTSEGIEQYGFGFNDRKGREIGAIVRQGVSVYSPTNVQHAAPIPHDNVDAGTYLTAYIHSTRGGDIFGASGRFKLFKIEGENGEANASNNRSVWIAIQIQDMKAKQKARNAA